MPLCRAHHQELHRHGNEKAWWANLQITPLVVAEELWDTSQLQAVGGDGTSRPQEAQVLVPIAQP
jgi:hypothetical protein